MASRRRRPLRAVFFDAGNTLLSMNYPAVQAQLRTLGVTATVEAIERAEWLARVRLDADLASPSDSPGRPGGSGTGSGADGAGAGQGLGPVSRSPSLPGAAPTGPTAAAPARPSTESPSTAGRYVRHVLEQLGVEDAAVVDAMVAWRRDFNRPRGLWTTALPGARAALALVREAGLAAALISNSNGQARSIVESAGLAVDLDFVIDSGEAGVEKPDPAIFRLALDRAGVAAEEAAYVGDLYSVDVLGARAAGIEAVLLDPGGHWGRRDCLMAPDTVAAVRLLLDGSTPVTPAG